MMNIMKMMKVIKKNVIIIFGSIIMKMIKNKNNEQLKVGKEYVSSVNLLIEYGYFHIRYQRSYLYYLLAIVMLSIRN